MIIQYRGFQIDPVRDPQETGAWDVCPVSKATSFEIYPDDIDEDQWGAVDTLAEAFAAIDWELDQ